MTPASGNQDIPFQETIPSHLPGTRGDVIRKNTDIDHRVQDGLKNVPEHEEC